MDRSCRREPDLECSFPSITATCRGGLFAPRLQSGDRIAYLTVKRRYLQDQIAGWRLVAVLRVRERLPNHNVAADWYRSRALRLPSNCLVDGNPPMPLDQTNGHPPKEVHQRVSTAMHPEKAVRLWDAGYRSRVNRWPVLSYVRLNISS